MTDNLKATIREAGGIVHGDGNIFFTNSEQFLAAARVAVAGAIDARGKEVPATVTERPDYIRCIAHDHADLKNESWCGLHVGMEFHFQGVDHAAEHGRQNGRLVACPECVAAITTALQNGCEGTS